MVDTGWDFAKSGAACRPRLPQRFIFTLLSLLTLLVTACGNNPRGNSDTFTAAVLSTRAELVTGGDALVQVTVPASSEADQVRVTLNGANITAAFKATDDSHTLVGLVEGLQNGSNTLAVEATDAAGPKPAELTLTNHPITGPLFAGPQEEPFFCQTQEFKLANGDVLGAPLDEDCSAETKTYYVYRATDDTIKPLADTSALPADVAQITTLAGVSVPYVVRIETGTINRAIYETAMLDDPTDQVEPDPWTASPGWNGRLIYTFGGGCRTGWYVQGASTGGVLDDYMLRQGYGVASASLNVFGNNCNDLLAAETMTMVKEHFIESYGRPRFTIGWGCSGGSYQVHQIGDNYPGLLDGIIPGCSFPEVGFATIHTLADSRLLEHYFNTSEASSSLVFTKEQQRLISGFGVWESLPNLSGGAARIDPVPREDRLSAEFKDVVPASARYDPESNPDGARATVYDHTINAYGEDPATGFARRPLDNVGIQYGLEVLNEGGVTVDQFLDLNEKVGGFDINGNFIADRMVADLEATRAAYRTGRLLYGGAGLATMPIIDYRAYTDLLENGDIHMRFYSFATRERLIKANGNADNQVMLAEDFSYGYYSSESPVLRTALDKMDEWLVNLGEDTSADSQATKVVRAKPADLVDACFTPSGEKIVEEQTYDGPGRCNELYPSFPAPRLVAGEALAYDIIKCTLKPVDTADYQVAFTPEQMQRLASIFPAGVCDWGKPGVEQQPLKDTWLSFN